MSATCGGYGRRRVWRIRGNQRGIEYVNRAARNGGVTPQLFKYRPSTFHPISHLWPEWFFLTAFRNWMNSLGANPFVSHLYNNLSDGIVLFQVIYSKFLFELACFELIFIRVPKQAYVVLHKYSRKESALFTCLSFICCSCLIRLSQALWIGTKWTNHHSNKWEEKWRRLRTVIMQWNLVINSSSP